MTRPNIEAIRDGCAEYSKIPHVARTVDEDSEFAEQCATAIPALLLYVSELETRLAVLENMRDCPEVGFVLLEKGWQISVEGEDTEFDTLAEIADFILANQLPESPASPSLVDTETKEIL